MCFPSNLLSSSLERDLEQFFGEVGELAEVAPYDDSLEPLATEEEVVSQITEILPIIQQIKLFHTSVVLRSVSCFLLLLFFSCGCGLNLLLLC